MTEIRSYKFPNPAGNLPIESIALSADTRELVLTTSTSSVAMNTMLERLTSSGLIAPTQGTPSKISGNEAMSEGYEAKHYRVDKAENVGFVIGEVLRAAAGERKHRVEDYALDTPRAGEPRISHRSARAALAALDVKQEKLRTFHTTPAAYDNKAPSLISAITCSDDFSYFSITLPKVAEKEGHAAKLEGKTPEQLVSNEVIRIRGITPAQSKFIIDGEQTAAAPTVSLAFNVDKKNPSELLSHLLTKFSRINYGEPPVPLLSKQDLQAAQMSLGLSGFPKESGEVVKRAGRFDTLARKARESHDPNSSDPLERYNYAVGMWDSSDTECRKPEQRDFTHYYDTGNGREKTFPPMVEAVKTGLEEYERHFYSGPAPDASVADAVRSFARDSRMIPPVVLPGNEKKYKVTVGPGSTFLYREALPAIIKNQGDIVIMPIPTYGMFIDQIEKAGGEVFPAPLLEEHGYKLMPSQLETSIQAAGAYAKNKYLKKLGKTEEELSESEKEKMPKVRALYFMTPHNPIPKVYTEKDIAGLSEVVIKHPDLTVINDLGHMGIEYSPRAQSASFHAVPELADQVYTLLSTSKTHCAADLKAAAAIGPSRIIETVEGGIWNTIVGASDSSHVAVVAAMGDDNRRAFRAYTNDNNDYYKFNRNLMASIIEGIDKVKLSDDEKGAVKDWVKKYAAKRFKDASEHDVKAKAFESDMLKGIPGLKLLCMPEGTFFHAVDVSGLIGKYIGETRLEKPVDVAAAMENLAGVRALPTEMMGSYLIKPEQVTPIVRMGYSVGTTWSAEGLLNIKTMISELVRDKPYRSVHTLAGLPPLVKEQQPSRKITSNVAKRMEELEEARKKAGIEMTPVDRMLMNKIAQDISYFEKLPPERRKELFGSDEKMFLYGAPEPEFRIAPDNPEVAYQALDWQALDKLRKYKGFPREVSERTFSAFMQALRRDFDDWQGTDSNIAKLGVAKNADFYKALTAIDPEVDSAAASALRAYLVKNEIGNAKKTSPAKKEFMYTLESHLVPGDRVMERVNSMRGFVKSDPTRGTHGGWFDGKKYFTLEQGGGVMESRVEYTEMTKSLRKYYELLAALKKECEQASAEEKLGGLEFAHHNIHLHWSIGPSKKKAEFLPTTEFSRQVRATACQLADEMLPLFHNKEYINGQMTRVYNNGCIHSKDYQYEGDDLLVDPRSYFARFIAHKGKGKDDTAPGHFEWRRAHYELPGEVDHMLLITALNTSAIRYAIEHGMPPETLAKYDDIYQNPQKYSHTGGSKKDFPEARKKEMEGSFPGKLASIMGEFPKAVLGDNLCEALYEQATRFPNVTEADRMQAKKILGEKQQHTEQVEARRFAGGSASK